MGGKLERVNGTNQTAFQECKVNLSRAVLSDSWFCICASKHGQEISIRSVGRNMGVDELEWIGKKLLAKCAAARNQGGITSPGGILLG